MPFTIVRNDITAMQVDAIVNTANPRPAIGGGTDSAVHKKAGPRLLEARKRIGHISPGQAAITPAFGLDAEYVIHTVGPVWVDGSHGEKDLLADCYRNSLQLAKDRGCQSVAFPLISTGTYQFPKGLALEIATGVISRFVLTNDIMVYLVVFDKASYTLSEKLMRDVKSYIDNNYAQVLAQAEYSRDMSPPVRRSRLTYPKKLSAPVEQADMVCNSAPQPDWDNIAHSLGKTFSETLLELIDRKGLTHAEAYSKANIDRKHFNKIKNNKNYKPTRYTVLAFAIALELDIDRTKELLETAGLALSKSNLFDVIVSFFIENGRYNIFELNDVLFEYDMPLLGC
ncbi:MAG: macro domain-containing protein [Oscillospiraceae bacterium]|nr:macro domain-containing protein [Oscillospiraceae bacterium]